MKILVGLIEHFGDVVACEPVTRYLRAKYPHAHLSWAIQKPYRELIDSNPNIDGAIVLGCLTDWIKLYHHSKNEETYNLIVDLHVNYRWCEECRVPLVKERGNPFVNTFEWFDYGPLLEAFCAGAGLPKLSAQPNVYIKDEHRSAVDALQLPPQYCVIHRDSNSAPKDWPDEKWLTLVRFLAEELKLPVVEVGSQKYLTARRHGAPGDKAATRMPLGSLVVDLMNRTKLLETAEIIRRARFFIGIDSGPAHLANATKTPGVVLLGRLGYFRQYTPFTGYYASQSPEVYLLRNLTGPVAGLSVEEVVEATRALHGVIKCPDRCKTEPAPGTASSPDPGYKRAVAKSGFFDQAWYVTHYPEVLKTGADPLDYFITVGAERGHSPGSGFDSPWYRSQRPDLAPLSDPLRHYLHSGQNEGLRPCSQPACAVAEDSPSAERMAATLGSLSSQLKVAATHDKSLPRLFAFYSPPPGASNEDAWREEVRIAKEHGVTGFCFDYHSLKGQQSFDIKAPFFVLCANEVTDEVMGDLLTTFNDPCYVKVNGKPILAIDKTHSLPGIKLSAESWRQEAIRNGFPGLYLVTVDECNSDPVHPRELGFDASYELPSSLVTEEMLLPDQEHRRMVDYRKFASFHMGRPFPNYKRFRTVMAPWEDTPPAGKQATVYANSDNDSYKLWLAEAMVDTNRRYAREERIVFLQSWNRGYESASVRRFLDATKEVVDSLEPLIALDQHQADPKVVLLYQRLMREKEEGAARSLQAMRQQNMHLHRELQRTIGEIHQRFYKTRSWRFTKPLRALARVLNKSD